MAKETISTVSLWVVKDKGTALCDRKISAALIVKLPCSSAVRTVSGIMQQVLSSQMGCRIRRLEKQTAAGISECHFGPSNIGSDRCVVGCIAQVDLVERAGHYAFLDQPQEFLQKLLSQTLTAFPDWDAKRQKPDQATG